MITIKNEKDSQKLMRELDDILHYEFKKGDFDKKDTYDFSKELENFLERFLEIKPCKDYELTLTNPKIYTADKERVLRFTCKYSNYNWPVIFYIKNYLGIEEVTVKDVIDESIRKYVVDKNMSYTPSFVSVNPYGTDRRTIEILEEKGKFTINYHKDSEHLIKVILSGKEINDILDMYDLQEIMALVWLNHELNWEYILEYLNKINEYLEFYLKTYNIKAVEALHDEDRNYFFKYVNIKDGKFVRFEEKNNDLVTILDENGIWHYSGDNVKIDADDNLNETVRFKSGINKRILGRKITRGEQSIKRVRDTLTHIIK